MSINEQDRQRFYERDNDYRVMRARPGRRLIRNGKGPRIVQLSPRTIGVTVKDDREWTEARIRAARSSSGDAA